MHPSPPLFFIADSFQISEFPALPGETPTPFPVSLRQCNYFSKRKIPCDWNILIANRNRAVTMRLYFFEPVGNEALFLESHFAIASFLLPG